MTENISQYPISKEDILEAVNIVDGLSYYGIQVDRHDKCKCPFHGDRHPSMKIYRNTNKWYCFVCNEGGNIIDYVMKSRGLTFGESLKQIDQDFNLGLYKIKNRADPQENTEDFQEYIDQAVIELEQQARERYDTLCKVRRVLWKEYLESNDLQLKRYIDYLDEILDDFTMKSAARFI